MDGLELAGEGGGGGLGWREGGLPFCCGQAYTRGVQKVGLVIIVKDIEKTGVHVLSTSAIAVAVVVFSGACAIFIARAQAYSFVKC